MIPRVGEPVDPDRCYTLRPGAYVILPRGPSVLLTVQMDDAPDIQLPGGGIDPGESPRVALYREVMEETGWSISVPTRLGAFRRFVFMPEYGLWAEKLCTVYVARPARQVRDPIEPDHDTIWMSIPDAIDSLGSDGDRLMMRRYGDRLSPLY